MSNVTSSATKAIKLQQQWKAKSFPWQQALMLLKAQTGIDILWLSIEEWETKRVSKENQVKFGFKSPKLSKILLSLGMKEKEVSTLLSSSTKQEGETKVLSDRNTCLEQGNSIYYSSCQATDSRAAWKGDTEYNQVDEDLKVVGKSLFFWVTGQPMSSDGKGYKARAKLRLIYEDIGCSILAGLYVDRPYGQHQLLLNNFYQLEIWWENYCNKIGCSNLPILMPPVWQRADGAGNDFQEMYGNQKGKRYYCPSAEYGYQDTLSRGIGGYNFFVEKTEKESLLMQAYKKRTKIGGVYLSSLSEVKYNPQKGLFAPVITLPKWKSWDELDYKFFNQFHELTGKRPKNITKVEYYHGRAWKFKVGKTRFEARQDTRDPESFTFHTLIDLDRDLEVWNFMGEEIPFGLQLGPQRSYTPQRNIEDLGFLKPSEIPYSTFSSYLEEGVNCLIVKFQLKEGNFFPAVNLKDKPL